MAPSLWYILVPRDGVFCVKGKIMQLEMSFKNLEADERIKNFISEKSEKLGKFFNGKIHVRWSITYEHGKNVAHLHVVGNHLDFFSDGESENLFTAVEQVLQKLETQLKKKKEKVKDHHAH